MSYLKNKASSFSRYIIVSFYGWQNWASERIFSKSHNWWVVDNWEWTKLHKYCTWKVHAPLIARGHALASVLLYAKVKYNSFLAVLNEVKYWPKVFMLAAWTAPSWPNYNWPYWITQMIQKIIPFKYHWGVV